MSMNEKERKQYREDLLKTVVEGKEIECSQDNFLAMKDILSEQEVKIITKDEKQVDITKIVSDLVNDFVENVASDLQFAQYNTKRLIELVLNIIEGMGIEEYMFEMEPDDIRENLDEDFDDVEMYGSYTECLVDTFLSMAEEIEDDNREGEDEDENEYDEVDSEEEGNSDEA